MKETQEFLLGLFGGEWAVVCSGWNTGKTWEGEDPQYSDVMFAAQTESYWGMDRSFEKALDVHILNRVILTDGLSDHHTSVYYQ